MDRSTLCPKGWGVDRSNPHPLAHGPVHPVSQGGWNLPSEPRPQSRVGPLTAGNRAECLDAEPSGFPRRRVRTVPFLFLRKGEPAELRDGTFHWTGPAGETGPPTGAVGPLRKGHMGPGGPNQRDRRGGATTRRGGAPPPW
ncbi:unnamed protein product [Arctogadus glacialis]